MRQWIVSALVQIMACRLFGAKLLFFLIKIQNFSVTKMHLINIVCEMEAILASGGGGWVKIIPSWWVQFWPSLCNAKQYITAMGAHRLLAAICHLTTWKIYRLYQLIMVGVVILQKKIKTSLAKSRWNSILQYNMSLVVLWNVCTRIHINIYVYQWTISIPWITIRVVSNLYLEYM